MTMPFPPTELALQPGYQLQFWENSSLHLEVGKPTFAELHLLTFVNSSSGAWQLDDKTDSIKKY